MAITTNIELIEKNLTRLGVDINQVRDILLSSGTGFAISYNHLDNADSICQKVRTVLYSWLTVLGVKDAYTISARHKAIQVSRKITAVGISIPIKVAHTNSPNKRSGNIVQSFSEDINESSTMPDQDAIESVARIEAALRDDNYFEPEIKMESVEPPKDKPNVFELAGATELKAKQDAEMARVSSNLQEIDNGKEV